MNEGHFLKKLINRLFSLQRARQPEPEAEQNGAMLRQLLYMIAHTEEDELSCDEVFELLDQYAELVARNEDAANLLPLVRKHLDRCGDCREEYEALARVLEASSELGG